MDQRELIGDQQEALRSLVDEGIANTWTALPGVVQSFDASRMTCVVQVTTKFRRVQTSLTSAAGTVVWESMKPIPDVPVVYMGGGGFSLTFRPTNGDECLLIFSSRCIDGWWSKGGVQPQPVLRHHNLSDGFALIGPRSLPNILGGISPNAQLRTNDGSAYIELTPAGAVNIVARGGVHITGDLSVTGNITATGTITSLGEGTFNTIKVSTHEHTNVRAGTDISGGPVNA